MTRFFRLAVAVLAAGAGFAGWASAASAARGPVEVPRVSAGDSDGDGLPEASASLLAGGPCACRCPVMGGALAAGAAGEVASLDTRTALVVCGTRLTASVDPAPADGRVPPRAGGVLRFDPGGIGRGGPGG